MLPPTRPRNLTPIMPFPRGCPSLSLDASEWGVGQHCSRNSAIVLDLPRPSVLYLFFWFFESGSYYVYLRLASNSQSCLSLPRGRIT
jgi:hypothetical protein